MQTQSMVARRVLGDLGGCAQAVASTGVVLSTPSQTGRSTAGRLAGFVAGMLLAVTAPWAAAADAPAQDAPLKPNLEAGAETAADVCGACHGEDGNSAQAANPHLAGQHLEYILKQLRDFKPGEDGKPAARNNAVMAGFAASLSPQDALDVAAFFAAQTFNKPAASRDPVLVEQGRAIYRGGIPAKGVPACAACHGPAGDGMPAQYPALHGQFADYTAAQLIAFRDGTRKNNQPMTDISLRMTDQEIKAVADYIAGLRPEKH
ncbi:MAG: c-type cytochrome [Lautropia sp.]|nr:c-type cytochrome [Lautropia sp.]